MPPMPRPSRVRDLALLPPLGLDFVLKPGELVITTKEAAAKKRPGLAALQQALPNLKEVVVNW